jgi:ApaG protein
MAASPRLVRAAYRALLREAARVPPSGLRFAAPLDLETVVRNYGRGHYETAAPPPEVARALVASLFPGPDVAAALETLGLTGRATVPREAVREAIRRTFRQRGGSEGSATGASSSASVAGNAAAAPASGSASAPAPSALPLPATGVDAALRHLATLARLRAAAPASTSSRTELSGGAVALEVDIATTLIPTLPAEAMARAEHWPFAYRIRIANVGSEAVQLVGREWKFTDARGGVISVPRGSAGVVGQAPLLRPSEAFTYISGVQLATPRGVMEGSFQMRIASRGDAAAFFDTAATRTALVAPPSATAGEAAGAGAEDAGPASKEAAEGGGAGRGGAGSARGGSGSGGGGGGRAR